MVTFQLLVEDKSLTGAILNLGPGWYGQASERNRNPISLAALSKCKLKLEFSRQTVVQVRAFRALAAATPPPAAPTHTATPDIRPSVPKLIYWPNPPLSFSAS